MTIEEKIEVMQHFADGGEVQVSKISLDIWFDTKHPEWNFSEQDYRIKPEPIPQSLEDRIKAEYPEYEVVMLEWGVTSEWVYNKLLYLRGSLHIYAQSMKGFAGYVYLDNNGEFIRNRYIVIDFGKGYEHPVAVLFTKDSKEEA